MSSGIEVAAAAAAQAEAKPMTARSTKRITVQAQTT